MLGSRSRAFFSSPCLASVARKLKISRPAATVVGSMPLPKIPSRDTPRLENTAAAAVRVPGLSSARTTKTHRWLATLQILLQALVKLGGHGLQQVGLFGPQLQGDY